MAQIETHDIGILITFYEGKDNQILEKVRQICNLWFDSPRVMVTDNYNFPYVFSRVNF